MTQDWYDATDKGSPYDGVHALFIDFRKAFNLVDHEILLTKLRSRGGGGVNKSFWLWCQNFLTNRTQQVKFLDVLSRVEAVPAGLPQGAVISPTLFNIYVNDMEDCIPNELPTTTCKYADDCSQYELVSTGLNSKMQEIVIFLEDWATQNKMELNTGKTKDMWIRFTRSSPAPPIISIGNKMIERVTNFKLLGVAMQNDLKWKSHVQGIVKKASKRIYFVRACRKANLPSNIGLTTYCTILAGFPYYLKEDIERVQNRCSDIIGLPKNKIESLASRRNYLTSKEYNNNLNSENRPCKRLICRTNAHKYKDKL